MNLLRRIVAVFAIAAAASPVRAQVNKQLVTVHSPSIAGNLQGNSAEREVAVFLPESYAEQTDRRYPVVVFLHGFGASARGSYQSGDIARAMEAADAEFIVVVPDANSRFGGSIYADSPTTGNYEGFVTRDLIAYVDSHYRTLAKREARGLAGNSMGGCGALKLGMKHADLFSSIFAMSATCLTIPKDVPERVAAASLLNEQEVADAPGSIRAIFALASAWSPAPDKPPFYLEWPIADGKVVPSVMARWTANLPLTMVPQYTGALKSMTGIALDGGDRDPGIGDVREMDRELTRFAIPHEFSTYEGGHIDKEAERLTGDVLPFFTRHLAAQ